MGNSVAPAQNSFNAGRLSKLWAGRVDMAKYGNGMYEAANFLPLPQGPARRRSGTRFVTEVKDSTDRSWLAKFIYSEDESFVLEIGDGYIRFFTDNGQLLLSGTPTAWSNATAYVVGDLSSRLGVNYYCKVAHTNQQPPNATYWHPLVGDIYEIPSPYGVSDLTNNDGTFRLDMVQTGDVIFLAHPSYPPKKLSRFGNTNWTIVDCDIKGGPFQTVDPDQTVTVYASAATGSGITLTASSSIFTAAKVGTLFLLEQKKVDSYKVWEPAKAITSTNERRSDSNVYRALNSATTGTVKPTHREGAKFDGDTGVQWQYVHSGYGLVRITGVAGTTATADVVTELPSDCVGAPNASTKWAFSAWDSVLGYPALVTIFRERLTFLRGQQVWGSVTGDFENFASRDGAETLPDSAYTITIGSSETNSGVWMVPSDALLIGTRGAEFSVSEVTTSDVFGPGNIKATEESGYGSRQVKPSRIGDSTIMVQRSGRVARDFRYSFNINGYDANSLMVLSDDIAPGQIIQQDFALEPHSINWACCNNGDLIALTYLLEQDALGWHPHRIGGATGVDGNVESLRVIPAPDGTHDQVWMQVYRVINGTPRRYIEYFERDWIASEQTLAEAVFSDSAATFDGYIPGATGQINGGVTWTAGEQATVDLNFTPVAGDIGDYLILVGADNLEAVIQIDSATDPANVTFITDVPASLQAVLSNNVTWARDVIGGLGYLEGEEVTILVNGAAHPRRTVTGGQITLQNPSSLVQVGLPCDGLVETMRIEGGSANGTSQGKMKRVHGVTFRVHESLGGKFGPAGEEDDFEYRSDNDPMNQPPGIRTGDFYQEYPEGYNTSARIRIVCDQPLPFTLIALYPRMVVEDRP